MNLHRITIYFTALLAVAIVAVPSSALASSLLSGYGGPGQGNQAVLGSALVNGPKSGGGSGRSGGSSATKASQPEIEGTGYRDVPSEASPTEASRGGSGQSARRAGAKGSSKPARADRRSSGTSGRTAVEPAASASQPFYPAAGRVPSGSGGGLLGLSGADIVYVLIAFAVLVLLGVFTRRIAANPEGSARG